MDRSPSPGVGPPGGELKIKGQASLERRKSKAEDATASKKLELEKRENELKEKALRNKVVRSRTKNSG